MSQLQTIPGDHQAVQKTASDYQREFRKRIEGKTCDCGRPAKICKCGCFVCSRCDEIEQWLGNHHNMQRSHEILAEKLTKDIDELCEITRKRISAKSNAEKLADGDRGENKFRAAIKEIAGELVIFGHGEYHIALS